MGGKKGKYLQTFQCSSFYCLCTEFDDVRLVGGTSHCAGVLEIKHHREWRPVWVFEDRYATDRWKVTSSSVVCTQLGCGSAVSSERIEGHTEKPVWSIRSFCVGTESSLRECRGLIYVYDVFTTRQEVICSGKQ